MKAVHPTIQINSKRQTATVATKARVSDSDMVPVQVRSCSKQADTATTEDSVTKHSSKSLQ